MVPKLTYADIPGHCPMEAAMGGDSFSQQPGDKRTVLDSDAGTFRGNQNDSRVLGIG